MIYGKFQGIFISWNIACFLYKNKNQIIFLYFFFQLYLKIFFNITSITICKEYIKEDTNNIFVINPYIIFIYYILFLS